MQNNQPMKDKDLITQNP